RVATAGRISWPAALPQTSSNASQRNRIFSIDIGPFLIGRNNRHVKRQRHSQLTDQAAVPFESQRPPSQRAQDFEATACGAREHRLYIGVSGEAREQLSAQRRPPLQARLQPPAPPSSACPRPHEPRGTHRAWSRARESSRQTVSSCTRVRPR